jgi:hypothetical protein
MQLRPMRTLLATSFTVVVSTSLLPGVTGYGTILSDLVIFPAWAIVALVTSGQFADTHHSVVWPVAAVVNLTLFLVPAGAISLATRKHWPAYCSLATLAWCGFHLASLFWLFPATDGPWPYKLLGLPIVGSERSLSGAARKKSRGSLSRSNQRRSARADSGHVNFIELRIRGESPRMKLLCRPECPGERELWHPHLLWSPAHRPVARKAWRERRRRVTVRLLKMNRAVRIRERQLLQR